MGHEDNDRLLMLQWFGTGEPRIDRNITDADLAGVHEIGGAFHVRRAPGEIFRDWREARGGCGIVEVGKNSGVTAYGDGQWRRVSHGRRRLH